ncbi:hypothetical protein CAGGBEG34_190113 [Candidatus Glomeribacter gigasporarum BEG34]|uniref:Uncharacterized protein n=1 Tax=Candidatus Glomeribacter gigasporarum BEG34 TaxID=1070319 RepID=G2J844_9BURK|nr:hypothetical protein [Candidatus Glomeribacter gigasporarum]CCD28941.1 hypothetical protein CAGGBEG34_190113 [Candidatus Glomeribacter gigasporarum BEG34]
MSKLDAIQEYANSSTARRPATGNFALRVSGYTQDDQGRDAVTGVRLDTGETVTVVLRPYQGPLKAPRAEVKDFATLEGEISKVIQSVSSDEMRKQVLKGMRAKTEPGGVILVQRAYTERDTGIVSAGWLQSAAKYADHCTVVGNVMLRMDPVRYREQAGESHAYASATALATDKSQRIKSAAQLSAALMEAFSGRNESLGGPTAGRPIALIRLSDGNTHRAIEMALPGGKDPETNEYTLSTPSSAAAAFLSSPNGKQAAQLAGDPEIGVEVIPGSRFSLGPHAKLSLENSAGGLERINRAYRFKKDVPDETGFTPSYIVLHAVPGGHVFSTAEPLSNQPPLFHPREIATPHFSGRPTLVAEHRTEPNPDTDEAVLESPSDVPMPVSTPAARTSSPHP